MCHICISFCRIFKWISENINGWTSVRYWLRCMSSTESLFLSGTQAESRDSVNDIWAILTRGVGQVSAASLCWIQTPWRPNGDNWNTHVPPQTHKGGGDSLQLYTRCVRVSFLIFPTMLLFLKPRSSSLLVIYVDGSQSAPLRQYLYTMLEGSDPNHGR